MHDEHDCYDLATGDYNRPILEPKALVLRREVARARKPAYLEITAVLAAVGAIGTWVGAMLI